MAHPPPDDCQGMIIADQQSALRLAESEGELLRIRGEIDPRYQIAALTKAFDGGPVLLFEKVKGHPHWQVATNLFARRERLARLLRTTPQVLSLRLLEAVASPLPPVVVREPPCQEEVIQEGIDVLRTLPVIHQTSLDIGPVISGGVAMVQYPRDMQGGVGRKVGEMPAFNLSFHRLNPGLGRDWVTLATLFNRHFFQVLSYHRQRQQEFPLTINIGLSPALNVLASGGALPHLSPAGTDDLGVAGHLQGRPVAICKAKTVEAYALAMAEVVLEGKVLYNEPVHEMGEQGGEAGYFFPEFIGYEGMADRAFKVQISAITHRHHPCYYTPLADSLESGHLGAAVSEASIHQVCSRAAPGVFLNCHVLEAMRGILGVVLQCRIRHPLQEGMSQHLVSAAFGAIRDLRWVIVVDEDVDIFDPSDVLWALTVRTRPQEDINLIKGSGVAGSPFSRWSVDTTVPIAERRRARRPSFAPIELERWLSPQEIERGCSLMSDGARSIARRHV